MEQIKSPCIDICQYDDHEICLGCRRTKTEAKTWWRLNDEEKMRILENIKNHRTDNTDYYGYYM
jgi:hypothetical protein